MYKLLETRLNQISQQALQKLFDQRLIGIERECLRVSQEGKIAQTPHPKKLGSALTNPYITTDYSEALLELITPPFNSLTETLSFLQNVHAYVFEKLDEEILWASSMPCIVSGEASIPVAYYGTSNAGKMKTLYRVGLGYRYGRMMQVIAGIHYNFSFGDHFWPVYQNLLNEQQDLQDFKSATYLSMTRNIQRFGWIIPYLFGASPAVCRSFIDGAAVGLEAFDEYTYYQPYATSLRIGDIGYQNFKEGKTGMKANYDTLDAYIDSLTKAITTPCEEYQKIGVKVAGEYRQLNANLLQIENEYYSTVRPKQLVINNEKPSLALKRRGIRYVELRSLDLNVYEPMGVSQQQLYFMEVFLIFCLLHDNSPIDAIERKEIDLNLSTTAHRGREPGLKLKRHGEEKVLTDWLNELLVNMRGVAEMLDTVNNTTKYRDALQQQMRVAEDPEKTPSATILREMRDSGESFFPFTMRYSKKHAEYFKQVKLAAELRQLFDKETQDSITKQQQLEASDKQSFDDYLESYFAQR